MRRFKHFGAAAFLTANLLLVAAVPLSAQAQATPTVLSVVMRGPLPGFREEDATRYLAGRMASENLPGWRFLAASGAPTPPRNRIEWHFERDPYASGSVRQFTPLPQVQRLFGTRHRITAEAVLYLDDAYQTLAFGQATIQGGAQDEDLAAFIAGMTENLLGPHGAYRSIDLPAAIGIRPH